MMKRHTVLWLAGTCFAAVAAQAQGEAQSQPQAPDTAPSTAQPSSTQIQGDQAEIIVTAQKRSQTLIQVPQSMSVVSGAKLDERHATSLADYVELVPGLSIQQQNAGEARIILRGINTGGSSPAVAVYLDDTPIGSSTGQTNAAHLAGDIDPFDIQRLEVLRGPQGTLYGANSLGGLIKYVTTPPQFDRVSARAQAGVETIDGGGTGWSANGMVNVPLSDTLAVRASGFYRREPGYIDAVGVPAKDVNSSKIYGGRGSILFKPNDRLSIRLSGLVQNVRANGRDSFDADPVTLEPITADPFTGTPDSGLLRYQTFNEYNNVDYRVFTGTLEYDFGPATLTSVTSHSLLKQHEAVDVTPQLGDISPFFGVPGPYGAVEPSNITQKKFAEEVRLASPKSGRFEWLIGGYYTREPGQIYQLYDPFNSTTGQLVPPNGTIPADLLGPGVPAAPLPFEHFLTASLDSTYEEIAGFGSVTWHILPDFDVTGGARYSHNRQTTAQSLGGGFVVVQGGEGTLYGKSSEGVWTWSFAPRYQLNNRTELYARIAKGYRPGGPNVVPPGAPADYPSTFKADTLVSYEAGVRSETRDRKFAIDASLYYLDWKDIQVTVTYNTSIGPVTADGNGQGAKSYGAEVTATLRPVRGLTIDGSLTYNHTELKGDIVAGGYNGDQLPYAPHWNANLSADYDWVVGARTRAFVGGTFAVVSDRPSDFDINYETAFGHRLILPGYHTLDLRAGLDFKRYRIDLYVKNVTNKLGLTYGGAYGLRYANLIDVGAIRPRTFGATVGADF